MTAKEERIERQIHQAMISKAQMRGLPIIDRSRCEKIPTGLMSRTQAEELGLTLCRDPAALVMCQHPAATWRRLVWWVYRPLEI
jgi:hypothetical protein